MTERIQSWFRFYHETMHDRKVRTLTHAQRWIWVAALVAASESPVRGLLLITGTEHVTEAHLADMAGVTVREVRKTLPLLQAREMIARNRELGCWEIPKWDRRQFESDTSTERVRKHRDRKRSGNVSGNVSEPVSGTPTEQQRTENRITQGLQQQEQASRDPVENPAAAADDGRMVAAALEVIYSRRPPPHTNPKAHKRATLAGLRSDLAVEIARLDRSVPWTPETLADWLEPAPKPVKPVPKQEPAEPRSPVTWFPGCEPHKEPT